MTARRLVISGRVQGVGFRDWLLAEAAGRGLHGWVRNRRDGTVEALLHGDATALAEMLAACRAGPRHARVTDVAEYDAEPSDFSGFHRLPTT
ncbi:MAG: acylphosphatase [Rhodopila sp.]|nr:acylphosphatase [Rhodopila sp.]